MASAHMIVVSERTSCSSLLVDLRTLSAPALLVFLLSFNACLSVFDGRRRKDRAFKLLNLGTFVSDANMFPARQ